MIKSLLVLFQKRTAFLALTLSAPWQCSASTAQVAAHQRNALRTRMSRPATVTQAVILNADLATWPGVIEHEVARPVLEIGGRPFIAWQMRELQRFGVEEFIVISGPLSQAVHDRLAHAADALPKRATVRFAIAPSQAGSAGALLQAAPLLAERFLVVSGTCLLDTNLAGLLHDFAADAPETLARLLLTHRADAAGHAVAHLQDGRLTHLDPAPPADQPGLIYSGIAAMDRRVLPHCPAEGSLRRDVLPSLAASGHLRATEAAGFFVDIARPPDLKTARLDLESVLRRPALLLDRDGVLNVDHGYVGTRQRWDWVEGALDAIKFATDHGWHVFVITNQSGVARGYYSEEDVANLMAWAADEVRRHGGTIDDWRTCPYHPEATVPAYRRASEWRKPRPGMIVSLIATWGLTPAHCLLVGDQSIDLEAARNAGIRGELFPGGDLAGFLRPLLVVR
jgi:D,D-heptose 1,7-bisphosphate phosphatase